MKALSLIALFSVIAAVSSFNCIMFCGSITDYYQSCGQNEEKCHKDAVDGLTNKVSTCQCEFMEMRYKEFYPEADSIVTEETTRNCDMYCSSYHRAFEHCPESRLVECQNKVADEYSEHKGACSCKKIDNYLDKRT